MAQDTSCTLEGNLTRDPEIRYTQSGKPVVSLGLAVNKSFTRADGGTDKRTEFYDVDAWNLLAEHAAESLHKGDRIVVVGTLKVETWGEDDAKRSKVKVTADHIGASLLFHNVTMTKAERQGQREPAMAGAPAAGGAEGYDEEPF
jgi:single-strand DNA-binding protein